MFNEPEKIFTGVQAFGYHPELGGYPDLFNHLFAMTSYPFSPKSTVGMKAGQFWGVPLASGRFGCGVVLSIEKKASGKRDSRRFLAGLLDWAGPAQPTAAEVLGRRVVEHGYAHLKTITENGGALTGEVEPWWPWPPELENLDNTPTWGYKVISVLAQKYYGELSEPGAPANAG